MSTSETIRVRVVTATTNEFEIEAWELAAHVVGSGQPPCLDDLDRVAIDIDRDADSNRQIDQAVEYDRDEADAFLEQARRRVETWEG